jgi:hypothetical protein
VQLLVFVSLRHRPFPAQQRISELVGDRRLEKYCVWFLAALAGMPFVVQAR